MKTDRLMGILAILLSQGSATAPQLAERFEVSRRTINRDVETLCRAGFPLVTARGQGGGISLAEGFRFDRTLVTERELEAILAGLRGLDSVSPAPQAEAFLSRIGSPRGGQDGVFFVDLASHYAGSLTHKIELLRRAAQERRVVSFRYFSAKGESCRRVEPYRLAFRWSAWYLLGYCQAAQGFRLFKLNRLWELREEESFAPREVPPQELRFDDYFDAPAHHLKAAFDPRERYRLVEEYGPDCYATAEDGALLLERDFVSYDNMRQWVLSFGERVRVLEPKALADDLRTVAENLFAMYRET